MLQSYKLVSNNTSEGGTQETTRNRSLADTTDEEVDIINILVDQLESVNNLLRDQILHIVKLLNSLQSTQLSELIVPWNNYQD